MSDRPASGGSPVLLKNGNAHGAQFKRCGRLLVVFRPIHDREMPQLAGGDEARDPSTDDADSMSGLHCLRNATCLLDESSLVETEVRRIGKTRAPWQGIRVRRNAQVGRMVVCRSDRHVVSPSR